MPWGAAVAWYPEAREGDGAEAAVAASKALRAGAPCQVPVYGVENPSIASAIVGSVHSGGWRAQRLGVRLLGLGGR